MIKPSIGRVVLFTPAHSEFAGYVDQPFAAMVAYVWNDRMINIGYLDKNGVHANATSVPLLQDDDAEPEGGFYCQWMPYQIGQASMTEKAIADFKAAQEQTKEPSKT
jgi:hypothetical protein